MLKDKRLLLAYLSINNALVEEAFVDLIDDVFDNYHLFEISQDITGYTDWVYQFRQS